MTALCNKDNTYYQLSGDSYDNKKINGKKLKIDNSNGGEQEFKVQASRVDKGNGFQAMAVSPIGKDGKVDNDTIYFAYAGTNPKEPADLGTDLLLGLSGITNKQVETNPKKVEHYGQYSDLSVKEIPAKFPENTAKNSQFDEANAWTKAVLEKGNYKNVYGSGHSLGGTIAAVMAVMHNFDQTRTFSAPNGYSILPDEIKKDYNSEKYDKKIIDYTHTSDVIGMSRLESKTIGLDIFVEDVKRTGPFDSFNPAHAHGLSLFGFNGGSVKIKVDSKEAEKIAERIRAKITVIDAVTSNLERYMESSKRKARQIEDKYVDQVSSGGYKYIHPSDIENYMDELTKSGDYDFFDQDKFETTISTLHSHKKQLETFAEKIVIAGRKMESRDKELSEMYHMFEE
ncbi:hypothetical protein K4T95_09045 [Staphylococcus epidermidis]|uniref:hypothetical protein n=1 Tax=Staphylococcus epidermidis TaxID=1282 RepID=UPI000E6917C4|nr:hypothetical protein [Staphylococcus epidermidis]MBE7345812.1 hypothetical protein [Staphylococcus epidermidis]MBF2171915.1 hypothetical protein [Staphylococcus epidermidis]MBF9280741.1 hypothetical protein [Staphylococcus epidermidis]MCG1067665.1 hypothetical protein [Staphylococcus epidermidis]MCG1071500.1 hypothetical protein [Staphylococcus epidermidis]